MKNTYILLLVSAAFFAADFLYPADKYFGDTSAVFTSNTAWFSDEARTERTTPPTSGEDTAIFYKTKGGSLLRADRVDYTNRYLRGQYRLRRQQLNRPR